MRVRNRSEVRRLDKIRLSRNSSRILNLGAREKNFPERPARSGATLAARSGGKEDPTRFFFNDSLNRAIFIKHNIRPGEEKCFPTHRYVETKILVPFDSTHLELGGQSFFIGQHRFKDILRDVLSMNPDAKDERTERDLKVLEILRNLPSFDPFIVQEALRLSGIAIDPRYFDASYEAIKEIDDSVHADFKPLIESAIGKRASDQELSRFIEQVWNFTDCNHTNPFFEALHIPRSEWRDIVFSWKALLYYRYETKKADHRLLDIVSMMKRLQIQRHIGMCEPRELRRMERHLVESLFRLRDRAITYTQQAIQALGEALSGEFDANQFREILRDLSSNMFVLGSVITVFDQVTSYYMYSFAHEDGRVDGLAYEKTLGDLAEIVFLRSSHDLQSISQAISQTGSETAAREE